MTDDAFAPHRRLLFTVAYQMLGSASDAEDVPQETWPLKDEPWGVRRFFVRDPAGVVVNVLTHP